MFRSKDTSITDADIDAIMEHGKVLLDSLLEESTAIDIICMTFWVSGTPIFFTAPSFAPREVALRVSLGRLRALRAGVEPCSLAET